MIDSPPKRILIVEHDEATTKLFDRMLRLNGYRVQIALSAAEGLHDAETNHPDAILVDFHMPDVDGLSLVRLLRSSDEAHHTPVVVVTGDYTLDDSVRTELQKLGAEIRFKPLWLEDLASLVHDLLNGPLPS